MTKEETRKIEKHPNFDMNKVSGKRFAKEWDPFRYLETKDPFEYWWNPEKDRILKICDAGTSLCFCSKSPKVSSQCDRKDQYCFIDYNQPCRDFSEKIKQTRNDMFNDYNIDIDDDYWKERFYQRYKKTKEEICAIYRVNVSQSDWKEEIFRQHPMMRLFCKGVEDVNNH